MFAGPSRNRPRWSPQLLHPDQPAEVGQSGVSWRFEAIGTSWSVDTDRQLSASLRGEIAGIIDAFERVWSRFRNDSTVSLMSRTAAAYDFGPDAGPLLDLYWDLYRRTDGALTPLVGNLLEHLGYDAQYSLRAKAGSVTVPKWEEVIHRDGNRLTNRQPLTFDVGAAGKGYLVDLLVKTLQDNEMATGVIDASGDLRHWGGGTQRVGLEHPNDPGKVIGIANVCANALCASAVNRRTWGEGLHHVVDARTGAPTTEVIATWVIAPTALVADGVATALFFASPRALRGIDFSFVRMSADGRVECSPHFDGELFG